MISAMKESVLLSSAIMISWMLNVTDEHELKMNDPGELFLHCKKIALVKLTNHWLPQFHLLFSLFIYREARRSRTV